MSAPSKTVSVNVMERISTAIDAMKNDDTLPRTKRELERLSGLSHATVARAFVQDTIEQVDHTVNPWRLTERFAAMTSETGRRTAQGMRNTNLEHQLKQKHETIRDLRQIVDRQAQALYAAWVQGIGKEAGVTEIGVNRKRSGPR